MKMTTSHSHEDFMSAKSLVESRIDTQKKSLKQSLKNTASYIRYEVITPKAVLCSVGVGFAFGEITKRPHMNFSKAKRASDSLISWVTAGINIYALVKSYSHSNENNLTGPTSLSSKIATSRSKNINKI